MNKFVKIKIKQNIKKEGKFLDVVKLLSHGLAGLKLVKLMQSVTLNKESTKLLKNLLTVRKSKDEKNGYRIMAVKAFLSEKK